MSAKSQAGTPEWTAPEVLRGQVRPGQTDPLHTMLAPVLVLTMPRCEFLSKSYAF